jgi:pectin methylesterase-like acyl-CoA thioesterase
MKNKNLLFLMTMIFLGSLQLIKGATPTPAIASWPLIVSGASSSAASTSGQLDAVAETLGGSLVLGSGPTASIGTPALMMQRLKETASSGWPAETAYNSNRYIQFAASPKTGSIFTADTISVTIGSSGGTAVLKADIYYSTSPTFSSPIQLGTTNSLGNATYTRVKFSSLGIILNPGQSIYVRIYPWNSSSAAITGKYITVLNMAIGGSSIPIPVSSSIVWPCISDLTSFITAGTIMSGGITSLNNLLNYGSLTYGTQAAQSIYTGSVWQAETAPAEGRYIQFAAAPKSGGVLVLDSIRMKLAAWATTDFKVSVYSSKDPAFTLTSGIKLGDDIIVNNGVFAKTVIPATATVNSGEVLYLRLYPYHLSTSGDQWKLIGLDSVSVFGKVTGITSDPPTISTIPVSSISTTFITTGGTISSDGGAAVIDRGIVYSSTNSTPTISDTKAPNGTGSGSFTSQLTGLTAGTTYYIRAYATNSAGTSYGNILTFSTMATLTVPVLTTTSVSTILALTAASGGNVSDWGGSTVTTRGICWRTTSGPTITDSISTSGNGIGSYSCSLYSLLPTTTYYVRSFATNSTGTGYGNEFSFTTQAIAPDMNKSVKKDGTGDYTTIQSAFDGVPDNYTGRWIINVNPGTYTEKCTLASTKSNVFLIGQDPTTTIITYNAYAGQSNGAGGTWGTNNCFSVAIDASDFLAQNITFQNTIKNDGKTGSGAEQAVALRTKGDRQQYYNCRLLGYQDTYYTNSNGRIYMKKCYIEGSVDFIFGNGVMVLDSCQTFVNRDGGVVCAPNTDVTSTFGYVFKDCTLSSLASGVVGFDGKTMSSFYLGRPWQNNPKAVYISCIEPATVNAGGWTVMTAALNPFFAEYKCTGPGSGYASRSTNVDYLGRQLSDADATKYTIKNIFSKATSTSYSYNWMPSSYVANGGVTGLSELSTGKSFNLGQNSPNPVVNFTTISYSIPFESKVTLELYNLTGSKIATLANEIQSSGKHQILVDTQTFTKGIYFYTLKVNESVQTRKMIVE